MISTLSLLSKPFKLILRMHTLFMILLRNFKEIDIVRYAVRNWKKKAEAAK